MIQLLRQRPMAFVIAVALTVAGLAAPASAGTWPAVPTKVHVVAVTSSSLTVGAAKAANATSYRLWTSPNRADLREPALSHPRAARHSATSRTPRVTVAGLTYRSGALYYRFAAVNGSHRRLSDLRSTYLRPRTPAPTVLPGTGRPYLTWRDADVSGYQVRQTDQADPSAVTTYTLRGHAQAFTPPSLVDGHTYDLQVRALNGRTGSAWSAPAAATATTSTSDPFTVVTHNELSPSSKSYPSMASWSDRKDAMVRLYKGAGADVLLVQEGGQLVGRNVRQVDSVAAAMGSSFAVARTENEPGGGAWVSHGVYVVYDSSRFAPVGAGWTIDLPSGVAGKPKYAAFQVLRDLRSGSEFMAVSTHLIAGTTAAQQRLRTTEIQDVLAEVQRHVTQDGGISVILGGCLHESRSAAHPSDAPSSILGGAAFTDTLAAAQRVSGGTLDTFNRYERPIRPGSPFDRVFAGPGVAVTSWAQLMHRSGNNLAGVIPSDHNPVAATVLLPGS